MLVTSIIVLLFSFSPAAAQNRLIEITSAETPVFANIGTTEYDARLFRGSIVTATEMKDGWYHVRLRNGIDGWVPNWVCTELRGQKTPPPYFPENFAPTSENPAYAAVIAEETPLRSIPYSGLQAKRDVSRIGILTKGTVVKVTDAIFHWLRVELSPWEIGWVYDEAVRPAAPQEAKNARAQITAVDYGEDNDIKYIEFTITHPAPFILRASTMPFLVWFSLYSIDCQNLPAEFHSAPNMPSGVMLLCDPQSSTVTGMIYAPGSPAGYSAEMKEEKFRITAETADPALRTPHNAPLIVLDPGHGAPDPTPKGFREGAASADGKLKEKNLTLDIARRLKDKLERAGYRVAMTREGDSAEMMDLYRRVEFADQLDADLFISIHINGDTDTKMSGAEVYWYDPVSRPLAEHIASQMRSLATREPGKSIYASFAVIRQTRRPAVLVEAAYLSNPTEAKKLASEDSREKIADEISLGIQDFLSGF
ncbi:MAG: N-acetylmuramoyl-L-alanine amidase [bacterium]